ncbi:MAG TPA: HIT domain-containing protein [Mycobacteriales bacterium]|jgi:histidine triad (HIT) family protein|nr:HIT domain-containing protein [Mycobacteriales bacterium]
MSDCLFCRIVAGEIPSDEVHSGELTGESTYAFRDVSPQAPTHVLVVPREHYPNAAALAAAKPELLAGLVADAHAIAVAEGLEERGYRLVFNTGPDAQQSVQHVHLHLLGGRSFGWPPG